MRKRRQDSARKIYALVALLFLITTPLLAEPSYAASSSQPWEFKGAYTNYTENVSSNLNYEGAPSWSNYTVYFTWNITPLQNDGNYSFTSDKYAGNSASASTSMTTYGNSSLLVSQYTKYTLPTFSNGELWTQGLPAVNVSVLKAMISDDTVLYLNVGAPDLKMPVNTSQTVYDYKGTDIKAFKGVSRYTFSNLTEGNTATLNYTVYISAKSGLMLDLIQNYTANVSARYTEYTNYSMELNSTNIQVADSSGALSYDLAISAIVGVTIAATISLLLVQRRRKMLKRE